MKQQCAGILFLLWKDKKTRLQDLFCEKGVLPISIQGKMCLNIRQIFYFDRESSNEIDQPSKIGSAGHIIMLNSRGLDKFTFQNSFDLLYSHQLKKLLDMRIISRPSSMDTEVENISIINQNDTTTYMRNKKSPFKIRVFQSSILISLLKCA